MKINNTDRPEYRIWASMLQRCRNEKNAKFSYYGGRGILVCERWALFTNFIADVGARPSIAHTLDRIDNDGPYSPENCRWASRKTQMRNTRQISYIEFRGERLQLCEWADRLGISASLICNRMNKLGWSVERALTTPADKSKYKRGADSMAAKAKAAGLHRNYVYERMKRGMTLDQALATPIRRSK